MKDATKTAEFQKLYDMYQENKRMKHVWSDCKPEHEEYCIIEQTLEDVALELFGVDLWKFWTNDEERKPLPKHKVCLA